MYQKFGVKLSTIHRDLRYTNINNKKKKRPLARILESKRMINNYLSFMCPSAAINDAKNDGWGFVRNLSNCKQKPEKFLLFS